MNSRIFTCEAQHRPKLNQQVWIRIVQAVLVQAVLVQAVLGCRTMVLGCCARATARPADTMPLHKQEFDRICSKTCFFVQNMSRAC
jgi:hypothetical protein